MKEIKKYVALDGTVWNSEEECAYHEKFDVEQMYEWAMKIKAYCKHTDSCTNCPFVTETNIRGCHCLIADGFLLPEQWGVDDFESDE